MDRPRYSVLKMWKRAVAAFNLAAWNRLVVPGIHCAAGVDLLFRGIRRRGPYGVAGHPKGLGLGKIRERYPERRMTHV